MFGRKKGESRPADVPPPDQGGQDASANGTPPGEGKKNEEEVSKVEPSIVEAEETAAAEGSDSGAEEGAARSKELELLRRKADENYDNYVRAVADLENAKKRHAKDRQDLLKYAGENLARDLLEVVDNLELALKQDTSGVRGEFLDGIKLIHSKFMAILDRYSIRGESALGKQFDPARHEALASVPSDKPAGTIMEEFKKAYVFKDKLLRPGQVVVATPAAEADRDHGSTQESNGPDLEKAGK